MDPQTQRILASLIERDELRAKLHENQYLADQLQQTTERLQTRQHIFTKRLTEISQRLNDLDEVTLDAAIDVYKNILLGDSH